MGTRSQRRPFQWSASSLSAEVGLVEPNIHTSDGDDDATIIGWNPATGTRCSRHDLPFQVRKYPVSGLVVTFPARPTAQAAFLAGAVTLVRTPYAGDGLATNRHCGGDGGGGTASAEVVADIARTTAVIPSPMAHRCQL
jgi:hypothetical protein